MTPDSQVALLDEVTLPSARGGMRPSAPLTVTVLRALTDEDLPALQAPTPVAMPGQKVLQIRHSHHELARNLAAGMSEAEASLVTGYSSSYISVLKADPAFRELLAYYATQVELRFVDLVDRMKTLGLSTIDELQRRLEVEPDGWTRRELMELAELCLKAQPGQGPKAGGPGQGDAPAAPGVSISVQFVTPPQGGAPTDITPAITIDQE